jgi:hypothetical protein
LDWPAAIGRLQSILSPAQIESITAAHVRAETNRALQTALLRPNESNGDSVPAP